MKKQIPIIFLLAFSLFTTTLSAQYEWRKKACPPVYQGGGVSFALGSKAYVVGGDTAPPSPAGISAQVWEYDATSNSWTQKSNFPHSANNPSCFVINDTAYVGLGLDNASTYHTDFWRYDQSTDHWTQVADFPSSARYGAMSFALNGKGYVGCGHSSVENDDFYAYDPHTNTWATKTSFPGGIRQSGVGAAAGGKGYMGMGVGNSNYYNDIYQYNDVNDSWAPISSFTNAGRYSLSAFVINDTLYVVGGVSAASYLHDCWSYSAAGDSWSAKASFGHLCPDSVFIQDAFVINGHAYMRPLHSYIPLHILLEFGAADASFAQQLSVLGNDTSYAGAFSRTLTAPDTSAVWSTGAKGAQINVTSLGTYWVRWNTQCGIAVDTIRLSSLEVGIVAIDGTQQFQVFPNPLNGNNIGLKVSSQLINGLCEIYDVSGKLVYQEAIASENSSIYMPGNAGVYTLSIKTNDQKFVRKIVKLQ